MTIFWGIFILFIGFCGAAAMISFWPKSSVVCQGVSKKKESEDKEDIAEQERDDEEEEEEGDPEYHVTEDFGVVEPQFEEVYNPQIFLCKFSELKKPNLAILSKTLNDNRWVFVWRFTDKIHSNEQTPAWAAEQTTKAVQAAVDIQTKVLQNFHEKTDWRYFQPIKDEL